ncbi:MAG: dihydrodipicolinate synthase family protein, partial [Candidatus Theseobacter exili]|nr:dihydrodipicolinate synthase family protein [Candidatus Theseobacter exili]
IEGGNGAISGCANLFPELMAGIYDSWKAGEMEKARQLQKKIAPFRVILKMGNPNSIVKRGMKLMGQPVGPVREPANFEESEIDKALITVLAEYS